MKPCMGLCMELLYGNLVWNFCMEILSENRLLISRKEIVYGNLVWNSCVEIVYGNVVWKLRMEAGGQSW